MLDQSIPELQGRIKDRTGVRIPGVQIASTSDLTNGQYWVLLHEVPLSRGAVHDDERFDRTMLEDLDRMVRRYLDTFLGFHEASEMVGEWESETWPDMGREELRERALSDIRSMVCFVGVLQRLIREQVPVSDLGPLIEILAEIDWNRPDWGPDAEEAAARVVEEVRRHERMRAQLPGNTPGTRLLRLPTEVEDDIRRWVQEQDGKRFLAIPRSDMGRLARVINAVVERVPSGADDGVALVVRDAELRPFVRRLVERDLPFLPVLAEQELRHHDGEVAPAPPEDARPSLDGLGILIGAPP
jgi:type III secretory pathway component EscV